MKRTGIFGAGQAGAMAAKWLTADQELVCFIDNNEKKQGKDFIGYPVCSLGDALEAGLDSIWLAVLNREAVYAIREQIAGSGFSGEVIDIQEFRGRQDVRLAALRLAAEEIRERGVQGEIAELGVFRGAFAAEMNRLLPEKELFLFDTFEGFDERDVKIEEEKSAGAGRKAKTGDFSDTSIEVVRSALVYPEKAHFIKGYFPESLKTLAEPLPPLALVSLDPDLYEPAYQGLKVFYPLLSPGGMILIHDYNSLQFPGIKKAVRLFCEENNIYVMPLMDLHGSAVIIK